MVQYVMFAMFDQAVSACSYFAGATVALLFTSGY